MDAFEAASALLLLPARTDNANIDEASAASAAIATSDAPRALRVIKPMPGSFPQPVTTNARCHALVTSDVSPSK